MSEMFQSYLEVQKSVEMPPPIYNLKYSMIIELIQTALVSFKSEAQRLQADQALVQYITTQPVAFIKEATQIFANEATPINIRESAATQLRRCLLLKSANSTTTTWDLVPVEDRVRIKNVMLSLLGNPNRNIMRRAADIVSVICCIELPRGQWPGIVQTLTANTKHQNQNYCLAAIKTLGFLCSLLKQRSITTALTPQQIQSILAGILLSMQNSNPQIKQTSINALGDSMDLIKPFLKQQNNRNLIFNQLLEIFAKSTDDNSKVAVLKVLIEFVRVNYVWLMPYLINIFAMTMPSMKQPQSEEKCRLAMEVWDTIATECGNLRVEEQNVRNYFQGDAVKEIVEVLLQNICYMQGGEEDPDNEIRGEAYLTLYDIGCISGDHIYDQVLRFVDQNIGNADFKVRSACLRAFCTLLEGANSTKMEGAISSALKVFLGLLDDSSIDVQYNAAFCLNKIAEQFPKCFFLHKQFPQIVDHLRQRLVRPPNISVQLCSLFASLAQQPLHLGQSNALQQKLQPLVLALISNAYRDVDNRDLSLPDKSYLAAMTLINNYYTSDFCKKLIPMIVVEFPKTYNVNSEKMLTIRNGLLTLMHSCLLGLNGLRENQGALSAQTLDSIYKMVIHYFCQMKEVTADGMYVIGALASFCLPPLPYVDNVWLYVDTALKKYQDAAAFKAALGCLVDFCHSHLEGFKTKLSVVPILIDSLLNEQMKRLRIPILSCLGDIFLATDTSCHLYLQKFMSILIMAYQGSIQLAQTDPQYSEDLRNILITVTTCILHTLHTEDGSLMKFKPYLRAIFDFVSYSIQLKQKPKIDFVEASLQLLIDILSMFRKEAREFMREPVIKELMAVLEKNNGKGRFTDVLGFSQKVIMHLM